MGALNSVGDLPIFAVAILLTMVMTFMMIDIAAVYEYQSLHVHCNRLIIDIRCRHDSRLPLQTLVDHPGYVICVMLVGR